MKKFKLEVVSPTENAFSRVLDELKKRPETYETLCLLQFDWPFTKYAVDTIIMHISDKIKTTDDEPDIYKILEGALEKYADTVYFKGEEKLPDGLRLATFIGALITYALQRLEIEIQGKDGSPWTIFSDESFSEWQRRYPGQFSIVYKPHQNLLAAKELLYKRITTDRMRQVLKDYDYEQTVLAGVDTNP